ncbi:MAG: phosphatidate cytidylyltransferase [Pseudomonadota bacterium]
MLKTRVITALILLPAFLAALFFLPHLGWEVLMAAVVLVAAKEWSKLAGFSAPGAIAYLAVTAVLLVGAHFLLRPANYSVYYLMAAASVFWLVIAPLWLKFGWQVRHPPALAITGWMVLIPTWLAAADLRASSPVLLLFVMAVVWIADSAAYFAGRKWGRHKLAPAISPGKTWEGVAGALVAVTAGGVVFSYAAGVMAELGKASIFIMTAILWLLTAVSVLGDLFESHLKRQAGVKDSGTILPGHGGMLDRIDSLTAVLPVAAWIWYFFLYWSFNRG